MRRLFLFILMLNVVYIAWQLSVSDVHEHATSPTINDAKTIVLLRELKHGEGVQVSPAEKFGSRQPDVVQQKVASENRGAIDDKKVTVSEAQVAGVFEQQKITPAQVNSQTNSCFTVGPFLDLEKLRGFVREIEPFVVNADFRDREEKQHAIYWVYIEPENNRKNARKTGKRLKASKIKDFYIIRQGEKNNGISLGHFKDKQRANGLAKKVKKLGFDVLVEPLFKTYMLYWLDYQLISGKKIPETIDNKYMLSKGKDKISRLSRDCET